MNTIMSMQVMAGMGLFVLIILFLKSRMRIFFMFFLRLGMGSILILYFNNLLSKQGIEVFVGLNFITLLTSGILGFPGVVLLFSISALKLL